MLRSVRYWWVCTVGRVLFVVVRCSLCVACLLFVMCCALIVAIRRSVLLLHVGVLVCAACVYVLCFVVRALHICCALFVVVCCLLFIVFCLWLLFVVCLVVVLLVVVCCL